MEVAPGGGVPSGPASSNVTGTGAASGYQAAKAQPLKYTTPNHGPADPKTHHHTSLRPAVGHATSEQVGPARMIHCHSQRRVGDHDFSPSAHCSGQISVPPLSPRHPWGYVMIGKALEEALEAIDVKAQDGAAVALAKRYAALIDADPVMVPKVGDQLLRVLVELGMTPKARSGVLRGGPANDNGVRSKLDELRQRRDRRAAGVDSS